MEYLGPFSKEINVKISDIKSDSLLPITTSTLKNGVLFELKSFQEQNNYPATQLTKWLCVLEPRFVSFKPNTLRSKLNRLFESEKKLRHRKKVKNYASVSELYDDTFCAQTNIATTSEAETVTETCNSSGQVETRIDSTGTCNPSESEISRSTSESIPEQDLDNLPTNDCYASSSSNLVDSSELKKKSNYLQYEISKKLKSLQNIDTKISEHSEKLKSIESRIGFYSTRNINKRDENAKKNRQLLRETERVVSKQNKLIQNYCSQLTESKNKCADLTLENKELKDKLSENCDNVNSLEKAEHTKLKAQKAASYYKTSMNKLRAELDQLKLDGSSVESKTSREHIRSKDNEIAELNARIDALQEQLSLNFRTKNSDGSFTDSVRLCIIELAGLEVAVEKASPVIQAVCKNMFGYELVKSDLPNPTTVQSIVDEGHFLAKTFISHKLDDSDNFGINRDGTTRRKQKIVDTSVTLNSGDVMSLGFNRVARETAVAINDVTKQHITEMANLNRNQTNATTTDQPPECDVTDDYIVNTLSKLAFTMSDRASNEKLADKLLNEWRDEILQHCPDDQKKTVHNFHCMAHVLLGFHKYSCDDMKLFEKEIAEEKGPLGRDAMPVFSKWSKKGTVVERVVRTTSETFGPAGDYLGLRDRWEAYCSSRGIKSTIGNYKDNRFNALFQTSAEIFVHQEDFLHVINSVKNPNLKIKSVQADLKSDEIRTLLQSFGLVFVKITGPYWNLITSQNVAYLQLYSHIQELASFLRDCSSEPALLLNKTRCWSIDEPLEIGHHNQYLESLFEIQEETRDLLFKAIKLITAAMLKCVEKQLVDFLPGGIYSTVPEETELQRTRFSHSTNLGCEHHFGDLDSSQKKRPNASLHHHSSVQLLKRNRKGLMKWLSDMPNDERGNLLKSARKGGRHLREIHINREKQVIRDINDEMTKDLNPSKKRKTKTTKHAKENNTTEAEDSDEDYEIEDISNQLPVIDLFVDNEYLVVAYNDMWYPGIVVKSVDKETAVVNFMTRCRQSGYFMWPARKDQQRVKRDFVLNRGLIPECSSNGRQWFFKEHVQIQELYEKYQALYF